MDESAARREARRRRILENSENRFKRISGVENKTIRLSPADEANTKNEARNGEAPQAVLNNDFKTPEQVIDTPKPNLRPPKANLGVLNQQGSGTAKPSLGTQSVETVTGSKISDKQRRTIMVISLAIFVNYFFVILEKFFGIDSSNSILNIVFLPLFAYEIFNYTSLSSSQSENKILFYLQLFLSSRHKHFRLAVKVFQILSEVLQDVLIFFFFFAGANLLKNLAFPIS